MDLQAYSGARISTIKKKLDQGEINLSNYSYCLIHVGTNDVRDFSVDRIIADFRELFVKFKSLSPHIKLYISSILPRPVDFDLTGFKCANINRQLLSVCSKYNIIFIKSYKRFLVRGRPIRSLFAFKDGGLHLNEAGLYELRRCFQHVISHI